MTGLPDDLKSSIAAAMRVRLLKPPPGMPDLFGTPALRKSSSTASSASPEPSDLFAGSSAVATMTPVATAPAAPPDAMTAVWSRFVQAAKSERIHVGALLQHMTPLEVNDEAVLIGVPDEFHRRLLSNQQDFLLKHLQTLDLEEVNRLTFIVREDLDPATPEEAVPDIDPQEYMQQKRQENPVIQAIFEQFGGEMVW